MATRSGRRCSVDPCANIGGEGPLAPFLSIMANNIQIYGADTESAPPSFIVKTLIDRGAVAYVKSAGLWAAFRPVGGRRMADGIPHLIRLIGDNGRLSSPMEVGRGADADVCVIPANPYFYPPYLVVKEKVDTLAAVSVAMGQNIDAIKQTAAIIYSDPDLKSQVEAANKARLEGKPTVSLHVGIGKNVRIETLAPNATCYLHDMLEVWANTVEELDISIGRAQIGEKTERRTDDEISVIENSACSTIDTVIDTFTRFSKWYALDARAVRGVETKRTSINEEEKTDDDEELDDIGE